jgi:uroporphyrin-III C-methyltransferase/precorrin-2 dehydrogenase/sirohydrochlorin ferrochelatase
LAGNAHIEKVSRKGAKKYFAPLRAILDVFRAMFYPIYLDLRNRDCLVVGGGPIATGKVAGLIDAGARVTVVALEASDAIARWHEQGVIEWHRRAFVSEDIAPAFMVIAATADGALNAQVYQLANMQQRIANAVDDLDNCNFIAPAIARNGAIQVAVSTSGTSPALAKQLRDHIQCILLTDGNARLAHVLGRWRPAVKQRIATYQLRQSFWEGVLASDVPALVAHGELRAAHLSILRQLNHASRPMHAMEHEEHEG